LLLLQEGVAMVLVDVSTREGDSQDVVVLCGVLDVVDAVSVAAALSAVAARGREIIVDLAGLAFMDSSGVAALVHGRKQARLAGGELLLAAPQPEVLRVLTLTRLIDVFGVCASVDEAAANVSRSPRVAGPATPRRSGNLSRQWKALRPGRRAMERGEPSPVPASQQAGA
jgi:anti-sigma B factor antagonist